MSNLRDGAAVRFGRDTREWEQRFDIEIPEDILAALREWTRDNGMSFRDVLERLLADRDDTGTDDGDTGTDDGDTGTDDGGTDDGNDDGGSDDDDDGASDGGSGTPTPDPDPAPAPARFTIEAEASSARQDGGAMTMSGVANASGGAYVFMPSERDIPFDDDESTDLGSLTFTFTVPETDWYTLDFRYSNSGNEDAFGNLIIDDVDIPGVIRFDNTFSDSAWTTVHDRVKLEAGEHTVTLAMDLSDEDGAQGEEGTPILLDSLTVSRGVSPSDETSTRALLMNNWEDMVAIHESAQLFGKDDNLFGPFLSQLRFGENWQQDQIDFATMYFRDVTNPDALRTYSPYFDSTLYFDENGIINVDYGSYLPTGEALPVRIEKDYAMVPEQPIMVERYSLTNDNPVGTPKIDWDVMNMLALPQELMQQAVWDERREVFSVKLDQGEGKEPLYLAFGAFQEMQTQEIKDLENGTDLTRQIELPLSDEDAIYPERNELPDDPTTVDQFQITGRLDGSRRGEGDGLTLGMESTVELFPTRPVELYFFYTMAASPEELDRNIQTALDPVGAGRTAASPQFWFERTEEKWQEKLDKAKDIPVDVNAGLGDTDANGNTYVDDQALATAFDRSIISILQSQQPEYGSFVAATNPAYEFKVWPRDSAVTAIGLTAAGLYDEAENYWRWMASVEEDGEEANFPNGTFYTNYGFWDENQPIDFVQPEWDAQGLYLIGVYHHYNELMKDGQTERAEAFINDPTIKEAFVDSAEFIRTSIDDTGFGAPDFSIWEEFFLYNVFTQVTYASGLNAAFLLADEIGREDLEQGWLDAATTIRDSILRPIDAEQPGLWNEDEGYFIWGLTPDGEPYVRNEGSANLMLVTGLLDPNDPRAQSQMDYTEEVLGKNEYGISRYSGDTFYFFSPFSPGGPYEANAQEPAWPQMTSYMGIGRENSGDSDWALNSLKWTVSSYGEEFMPPGEGTDWTTREPLPSTMVEPVTGAWYMLNLLNYTDQFKMQLPALPGSELT
jgi:hypothetical protein